MQGTQLVDRPFPDEPPLEQIRDNLLIGDVDTVAEKLLADIAKANGGDIVKAAKGDPPKKRARA